MHSGWLVEMASMWAFHGTSLTHQREALPVEAVNEYWVRNRVRFDGWNAMLTRYRTQTLSMSVAKRVRAWERLQGLIEEILLAEPLSRVCVAMSAELETRRIDCDAHAILHSVYISHCEVRNRCLKIILEGIDRGMKEADQLNRLRHYLEHWTDMLLGYFTETNPSLRPSSRNAYAFSVSRVDEFSDDFSQPTLGNQSQMVWSLQLAGCRHWLDQHCVRTPASPRMNQQVCEAAMGMIQTGAFDSLGCLRSRLIQSIEYGIDHADATVASLQSDDWESLSRVLVSNPPRKHHRWNE
jgi:hypothetical protein